MMNYSEGNAVLCLNSIVRHTGLQSAREQIDKEHKEGNYTSEIIKE